MALSFFRQRDIDEMDIYNIPEEFINYFETLDDMAKSALLEKRPDLAKALGFELQNQKDFMSDYDLYDLDLATKEEIRAEADSISIDKTIPSDNDIYEEAVADDTADMLYEEDIQQEDSITEETAQEEAAFSDTESDEEYLKISKNYYEGKSIWDALNDNSDYLEILTIPDETDKCSVHRIELQKKQIRFIGTNKSSYGLVVKICDKCNRAFLEESKAESVHKHLTQRNIRHTIYDLGLSTRYLRSNMEAYKLAENEKLYVPDTWMEENPICPIHDSKLFETPCEHTYKDRKISFKGYFCDTCNKILVRRATAISLQDQCHEIGLPEIPYETLSKKKPEKKPVKIQEVKPQYCVEDGKRTEFKYDNFNSYYRLTEEDTVVVGDSIYCDLENHETEEVAGLIWVQEKRAGRKLYLFLLGYCAQCQKYYMDIDDYKVIYNLGRPEVTILSNIDDGDFQITSGEVFEIEKEHLGELESDISGEITSIESKPDYVNPYATGDYDDGERAYAKSLSNRKYGQRLKELQGYIAKPYSYRVDISFGDDTEVYYVGAADIEVDGKLQVISANSKFGHDLINYQTIKVYKDGKEYEIKLSRRFDIEQATLYGYTNLRTDEDLIFKSGITDPFLVRVLNMRKRQHNMTDIFVTIQENQNRIVNTQFEKNIIVQGCAGSGKTMVLLHRLSSLKYKQKYFDFGKDAIILTPNEQFSLHIKGLAEELQIGNIQRISVEQYYAEKLMEYDSSFKPVQQLASEQNVSQIFVDYIYSDQFKIDFDKAYDSVISTRNTLAEILENLTDAMGQPNKVIDLSQNSRVIQQIRFVVEAMDGLVKQQEQSVQRAKAELDKHIARKQFLEEKVPEAKKIASNIVAETLPGVYAKIGEYLSEKQSEVEQNQQKIQTLSEEQKKVQRTIIMVGKRARLEDLDKQIKEATRRLNTAKKVYDDSYNIFSQSQEGKSDEEIVAWMRQVMLHIPAVREEVRRCNNAKESLKTYETEYESINPIIEEAQKAYAVETSKIYSDEVNQAVQYLYDKTDEYTTQGTFKMIFDSAVAEFIKENEIKAPQGKYYRYTLYAQLLFAVKYYGEVHSKTKFMCIDEGQDLALNEYRLIYELNSRNITFNIFGDVNQLIKPGRGISDWSALEELLRADKFKLNENYRNTNQITRFCNNSFDMDVLQTGVDGAAVREISRNELEDELSSMNISTERVAILVPRSVHKKKYLHLDTIPGDRKSIIGDKMENGYISLMYVDEVKGIEFDRVFVVTNGMTKNEKYIAYTRALSELILVVDESIKSPKPEKKLKKKALKEEAHHIRETLSFEAGASNNDVNTEVAVEEKHQKTETINTVKEGKETQNDNSMLIFSEDIIKLDNKEATKIKLESVIGYVFVGGNPMGREGDVYVFTLNNKTVNTYMGNIFKGNLVKDSLIPLLPQADKFYDGWGFDKHKNGWECIGYIIGHYVFVKEYMSEDVRENWKNITEGRPFYRLQKGLFLAFEKYQNRLRDNISNEESEEVSLFSKNELETELEATGLKALKRIAGSDLNRGTYLTGDFSDDEIMDMFDGFFSSVSRKDTTYKYAFLKSILDCIPKFDESLKISFDELFGRFTEIYWPLVVNYDIQQKVGDAGSRSYVEQLLTEAVEILGTSYDIKFDDLSNKYQKELIKKVKQKCKSNVVGALFGDTKQIFYSFDKKEEWLQLNPLMFEFIKKHEEELQEMNYYSWAVFISRVNGELKEDQVKKQANLQDVKGTVNVYKKVLKSAYISADH